MRAKRSSAFPAAKRTLGLYCHDLESDFISYFLLYLEMMRKSTGGFFSKLNNQKTGRKGCLRPGDRVCYNLLASLGAVEMLSTLDLQTGGA